MPENFAKTWLRFCLHCLDCLLSFCHDTEHGPLSICRSLCQGLVSTPSGYSLSFFIVSRRIIEEHGLTTTAYDPAGRQSRRIRRALPLICRTKASAAIMLASSASRAAAAQQPMIVGSLDQTPAASRSPGPMQRRGSTITCLSGRPMLRNLHSPHSHLRLVPSLRRRQHLPIIGRGPDAPSASSEPSPQPSGSTKPDSSKTAEDTATKAAADGGIKAAESSSPAEGAAPEAAAPTGWWGKLMFKLFGQAKLDKAKLASIGSSCALSYGAISNVNAISLLIIAWVTFGKSQGLSPLDPGCWTKYLAAYALLYASVGNLLRPARIALAISLTPAFDKIVDFFMGKFNFSKPVAFGATVFFVNVCGSFTYLFLGLFIATTVTGAPLFATTAA